MPSVHIKKQILVRKLYFSLKKWYIADGCLYIKYANI